MPSHIFRPSARTHTYIELTMISMMDNTNMPTHLHGNMQSNRMSWQHVNTLNNKVVLLLSTYQAPACRIITSVACANNPTTYTTVRVVQHACEPVETDLFAQCLVCNTMVEHDIQVRVLVLFVPTHFRQIVSFWRRRGRCSRERKNSPRIFVWVCACMWQTGRGMCAPCKQLRTKLHPLPFAVFRPHYSGKLIL